MQKDLIDGSKARSLRLLDMINHCTDVSTTCTKPFGPEFPEFSIRNGNTKSLQKRLIFFKHFTNLIFEGHWYHYFFPSWSVLLHCCCTVQQAEFLLFPLAWMLKSGSLGRNWQREGGRLRDSFRVRASQCARQIQIFLDKRLTRFKVFKVFNF